MFQPVLRNNFSLTFREDSEPTSANIRAKLDDLLYLIRFPSMGLIAFANGPDADGILDQDVGKHVNFLA